MKAFTNHTAGPKGVNIIGGSTVWIDPGQTIEIDPKTIDGKVPDLGKAADASANGDDGAVEALTAQVADLAKQVEALTTERDGLAKDKEDLTKQVEALTKPADAKK